MKLSIVIVTWNVREELEQCLRSIDKNRPQALYEVLVVDNASADGTAEAIRERFPNVKLIVNSRNLGFAAANNQGIEHSSGQYVLVLNPDTIVHAGTLDGLVAFMDANQDVGACGPRLLNPDGTIQASVRRFPTLRSTFYSYTAVRFLGLFRRHYKSWRMKRFGYDRQMDVDQVMGAALMVRRSALDQVGYMDEAFFMYYEEVDLCYRLKQAGWRIVFTPTAEITHLGGCSISQIQADKRILSLRSLLTFFRKHRGRRRMLIFAMFFKPAVVAQDILNFLIAAATYVLASVLFDRDKRLESADKIGKATVCLTRYSWEILFRI